MVLASVHSNGNLGQMEWTPSLQHTKVLRKNAQSFDALLLSSHFLEENCVHLSPSPSPSTCQLLVVQQQSGLGLTLVTWWAVLQQVDSVSRRTEGGPVVIVI